MSPSDLYVMFGKFLGRCHQFKDCEIDILIEVKSAHKRIFVGTFQISKVIVFKSTQREFISKNDDLIKLIISIHRNDDFIGLVEIDIEIGWNTLYYSLIVNLVGESFQIIYFVTGSLERKTLTISSDYPKFKHYEMPEFNIFDQLDDINYKFSVDGRALSYQSQQIYSCFLMILDGQDF